jgi:hypothetical protein
MTHKNIKMCLASGVAPHPSRRSTYLLIGTRLPHFNSSSTTVSLNALKWKKNIFNSTLAAQMGEIFTAVVSQRQGRRLEFVKCKSLAFIDISIEYAIAFEDGQYIYH